MWFGLSTMIVNQNTDSFFFFYFCDFFREVLVCEWLQLLNSFCDSPGKTQSQHYKL